MQASMNVRLTLQFSYWQTHDSRIQDDCHSIGPDASFHSIGQCSQTSHIEGSLYVVGNCDVDRSDLANPVFCDFKRCDETVVFSVNS